MPANRLESFRRLSVRAALSAAILLTASGGCRPAVVDPGPVAFAPVVRNDWPVSTPAAEGLDSTLVSELYRRAARVETLRGLLVVKNGRLVAERYFHGGSIGDTARVQSVTKSVTSALVGIALGRGCLSGIDRPMLAFFPELGDRVRDPRKRTITVEHLLQMRAGYPWEESSRELFALLYKGFRPSTLLEVPLVRDPGSGFDYSNLSSHLLGVVVARACSTDLRSFAEEHLFGPIGVGMGHWIRDWEGNFNGHADLHLTARDMAKFGLLYLRGGAWEGRQVVPEDWVRRSLRVYSPNAWRHRIGPNFAEMGYGYQWWSARAGGHRFHFAWGHGGQQIALVEALDLVIVVTADPLVGEHGGGPWNREKENLNLVADFIATLPGA